MTKILRVKIGTCHIENCGRCPAGSSDGLSDMFLGRFTRCGFTAYVYKADRLPKYPMCPLDDLVEEKQAPAEQPPKVSRSAEYLDKEKVLKDLEGKDRQIRLKDEVIDQLKDRIAQQDQELRDLSVSSKKTNTPEETRAADMIAAYLDELNRTGHVAGAIWKAYGFQHSGGPEQDSVYQRIERLEDQQKRILGDLNEAYPAGTIRKTTGAKIKELDRRIRALEKGASYVLKVKDEKPAEPEMVICPHSKTCDQEGCDHKTPHHETPHCQSFCEYAPCDTSRCLPVKK